jgi:hypothetical protein
MNECAPQTGGEPLQTVAWYLPSFILSRVQPRTVKTGGSRELPSTAFSGGDSVLLILLECDGVAKRWVIPGSRLLSHFLIALALGRIAGGGRPRSQAAPLPFDARASAFPAITALTFGRASGELD